MDANLHPEFSPVPIRNNEIEYYNIELESMFVAGVPTETIGLKDLYTPVLHN